MRLGKYEESFDFTKNRIKYLYKHGGKKQTHLYLKECARLFIRYLAGQGEASYSGKGIIVSRDQHGIPHLIPSNLRSEIHQFKDMRRYLIVGLLCVLSIYRLIDYKVTVELESVIKPFSGTNPTFDVKEAFNSLFGSTLFRIHDPLLLKLESAGPNTVKSA
jgi:hypothetical protein